MLILLGLLVLLLLGLLEEEFFKEESVAFALGFISFSDGFLEQIFEMGYLIISFS